MSIKCSLLGHRFDETSVERDREEDGSEVVITITELETCSRCGETRVVSENKEVTTMETPDAAGDVDDGSDEVETEDDQLSDYDPDGDDAEILGEDDSEDNAQATARTATIPDAEAAGGEGTTGDESVEDGSGDAVIIDDGSDDGGRDEHGGSPATADASRDDSTAATNPESGPEQEGAADTDADGTDADGVGQDEWPEETKPDEQPVAETAEPTMGESDGEWPSEPTTGGAAESYDDWPDETKRDAGEAGGAGPTLEEPASPTVTVPEGMFKCSECGFTTEVESSSLRAGDFCPDCRQGTLVQADENGSEDGA
jgi:hypothetical protein